MLKIHNACFVISEAEEVVDFMFSGANQLTIMAKKWTGSPKILKDYIGSIAALVI